MRQKEFMCSVRHLKIVFESSNTNGMASLILRCVFKHCVDKFQSNHFLVFLDGSSSYLIGLKPAFSPK